MLLIVGLGNPGPAYETTRHNVGFMLVDRLSDICSIEFTRTPSALWGRGRVFGQDAVLLKPQTYMNRSGHAVSEFKAAFPVDTGSIIAAYDDCDLPLGRLRLRKDGGSGGHRGIDSIIEHIGSRNFPRIRLGIGRPLDGDIVDYVLAPFTEDETGALDDMLTRGVSAVEALLTRGIDYAMNCFNSSK